jgi:hypothetical protein
VKFDFRPTTRGDAEALSGFLSRFFPARVSESPHMAWKYWTARPDWEGSRSFTVQQDTAIVAHAAAWPLRVGVPGQTVAAVHVIDWAADPDYPGAGIWLFRKIAAMVRLTVATGGSTITQRILPVIGFRRYGELHWFARPVRPLGQALTNPEPNWKTPARLVRNTGWALWPPLSTPHGWSATRLAPEEIPERLWPRPSPAAAVGVRDPGLFRYFVDSPTARHKLFGLRKDREVIGYFCLAFAPHVARIADLWLPSAEVEDWCAGFRTAAVLAKHETSVYEVSACASTTLGKEALSRAGFRLRDRTAVNLYGDAGWLERRELHVQMIDSDASSVSSDGASYLT